MLATALAIYVLDGKHAQKYTFQRVSTLKCILIFWQGVFLRALADGLLACDFYRVLERTKPTCGRRRPVSHVCVRFTRRAWTGVRRVPLAYLVWPRR